MPAVAITDAMPKIRVALYTALGPLVGTYQGIAKAYWLQAAQGAPLPLIVYQAQAPFKEDDFLNSAAGGGLFTIRALADSAAAAETLLASVPAAMNNLSVSGYGCRVTFIEAPVIPPLDQVHTAALTYRIELFQ